MKTRTLHFTVHGRAKMRFYGLSEQRVRRVLHTPSRIERGIAPDTIAMMQSVRAIKHPYEIWAMIEDTDSRRKLISAWKYPGITKPSDPLPPEILREIKEGVSSLSV